MTNNANEALAVTQADADLLDAITDGLFDWRPSAKRTRLQLIAQFRIASAAVVKQDLTGEGGREVTFEVWEGDLMVASSTSEADGLHYHAVYSQDGPVSLVRAETVRNTIIASGQIETGV